MSKKCNQATEIRKHLEVRGSITDREARDLYGCSRLSAKIFNMRHKEGYIISDEWVETNTRYGDKCRFKKYIYGGKIDDKSKV